LPDLAVGYSTEINIHNAGEKQTPVSKRVIPLVLAGMVVGREPNVKTPATLEAIRLPRTLPRLTIAAEFWR